MSDLPEKLQQYLEDANAKFEEQCAQRHEMGAEKYGEGTYLDKDTISMMQDELVDFANYGRYTFIKLELMRKGIMDWTGEETAQPIAGNELMGKNSVFQPVVPKQRRGE